MKRVPADVEQLIWLIAETGDSAAAQEFEHRFPEYKFELMRRMSTVKSLKEAKPSGGVHVPAFRMTPTRRAPSWRMPMVAAGFALALFAVAASSFVATRTLFADTNKAGNAAESAPNETSEPMRVPVQADQGHGMSVPDAKVPPPVGQQPSFAEDGKLRNIKQKWQLPISVDIASAPLHDAIQLIADQAGMVITILPKLENPTVSISQEGISGEQLLTELGKQYGFTPVFQTKNEFLIVPALEFMGPGGESR